MGFKRFIYLFIICFFSSSVFAQGSKARITSEAQHPLRHWAERVKFDDTLHKFDGRDNVQDALQAIATGDVVDTIRKDLTIFGDTYVQGDFGVSGTATADEVDVNSLIVDTTTLVANVPSYEDKVGIGTATPEQTLHVQGHTLVHTPDPRLIIEDSNQASSTFIDAALEIRTSGEVVVFTIDTISGGTDHYVVGTTSDSNVDLALHADGVEVMRLEGDGDVGIGILVPTEALTIGNGGKLQVNSAGDDKNTQVYHNDSVGVFSSSSGGVSIGSSEGTFTVNSDAGRVDYADDGTVMLSISANRDTDQYVMGVDDDAGNQIIITTQSNVLRDHGIAVAADPLFAVFSDDDVDVSDNRSIRIGHTGDVGIITTGALTGEGSAPATITNDLALMPTGNVGIGTATPTEALTIGNGGKLQVNSAGDDKNIQIFQDDSSGRIVNSSGVLNLDTPTHIQMDIGDGNFFQINEAGTNAFNIEPDVGLAELRFHTVDATGNMIIITNEPNKRKDHHRPVQADPRFYVYADDDVNVSDNRHGSAHHDGNDFNLTTGALTGEGSSPATIDNRLNLAPTGVTTIGDGGTTNYSKFETDGTLEFNGTATVFDDLRVPSNSIRLPGAGAPTSTSYKSGLVLAFSGSAMNTAYFNVQMPHSWKEGSTIVPHIHWTVPDDNAGDVEWEFSYSWANKEADFPAATTDAEIVGVVNKQDEHLQTLFTDITDGTKTISSILICSIWRDGQAGNGDDTYGSAAYLVDVDFHYEIDTVGSRLIGDSK